METSRFDLIFFETGKVSTAAEAAKLNRRLVAPKIKSTEEQIGTVGNFFVLTTERSERLLLRLNDDADECVQAGRCCGQSPRC